MIFSLIYAKLIPMKQIYTIIGRCYFVSSASGASISTPEGTVICSASPGAQASFVAPCRMVSCSDDAALVTAADVPGAVASGAGGGGGMSLTEIADHLQNSDIHVTQLQKEKWDNAVQPDELNAQLYSKKESTISSDPGSSPMAAHLITFAASRVPVGELSSISLRCRNDHPEYLSVPLFLSLYEQNEDGSSWSHVGVSSSAVLQAVGSSQSWSFDGVQLHGRALRVQPVLHPDDPFVELGSQVLCLLGFPTSDGSLSDSIAYLPEYSFSFSQNVSLFAPVEHLQDEDLHLREGEREKILGAASKDELTSLQLDMDEKVSDAIMEMSEEIDASVNEFGGSVKSLASEQGNDNLVPHYVTLAAERVPSGRVKSLSIQCRNNNPQYLAEAIFLAIYEQDEDGEWTKAGVSVAPVQQVVNAAQKWEFDDLELHGRMVRIQPVLNADDPFVESGSVVLGARVFTTDDGSLCDSLPYAPQHSWEYQDEKVSKFAPLSHAQNETLHLDVAQKAAVARLVESTPPVQQVGQSMLVNESTGAYMRLGGAFVGLDSGEKYQAAIASLDKEHGAGVRILLNRQKAYYKHGDGDELDDSDELVRKADLEAAALNPQQLEALDFILSNKVQLQALIDAAQAE